MSPRGSNPSVQRNDPCPCGSGKKFKKCCQGKAPASQPAFDADARQQALLAAIERQRAGDLGEAQRLYEELLGRRPFDEEVLVRLGQLHGQRGDFDKGTDLLRKALAVDPGDALAREHLAIQLRVGGERRAALAEANKLIAADRKSRAALRVAAQCYESLNRLEEAEQVLERLLALEPVNPEGRTLRARVLRRRGRLDEARAALEELLRAPLIPERRAGALYELGNVLDRLGEYDAAFECFAQGARERAGTRAWKQVRRRVWGLETAALSALPDELLRPRFRVPAGNFRPVFLVGFPRSGTTMLEQVLAAHPGVATSDELAVLYRLRKGYEGEQPARSTVAEHLAGLDSPTAARLRAEYETAFTRALPELAGAGTLVDKLPHNLLELPWIAALFPDARILVALRDPRDVCLSNFMQDFAPNDVMIETLQLDGTTRYYGQVMGYWLAIRDRLGLPWIELRYEDTVDDLERQARRLLAFLDLDWQDEVLHFHQRAARREISTPSYAAVAEPVHKRAVGRWRHYEKRLAPFLPRLEPFVRAFGYE